MFYFTAKIFNLVFSPSNFGLLLLLGGLFTWYWWPHARASRHLFVTGTLILAIAGFSPLSSLLTFPLEERFKRPDLPPDVAGIILLGGYENVPVTLYRSAIAVNESADRLLDTLLLAKMYPNAPVILTGGWATLIPQSKSAVNPIAKLMQKFGVNANRLIAEPHSKNTYQNAVFTRSVVQPKAGQKFILVTSAYHIPRAVGTFRRQGFDVLPWPTDYRTSTWHNLYMPFNTALQGLERTDLAFKEWLGLLAYRLAGRTDDLFPAPATAK
jgi:uncharacterized SAM-binding protein YcdF (DUF218 family)